MSLKKLFGLEKEEITDSELLGVIVQAKMENRNHFEIKGVKIQLSTHQFFECGILD
ncbi:hypothetical protein HN695_06580 [Candidatus Woesearchaeota archaeon]|jgi:hypothetical protein|nr:hypothetical protein [Candidatus Woesearchaeota archaeon]MBT5272446.1 hypothetical protein [Candidatus Woesearchaeota archaeon]MBT6041772.1 hypothetical protein [Candidatus Woesearchaeota archaeon]MBT6336692.1 hypothetical protein [Candidatus Woesearchaeota archaeon]MBT7927973.1 hypothetical protein [Candidatus Woesearchaeota archaeon]